MKYIVMWNSGYGDIHEVINADSLAEAEKYAYDSWHEEVQSQAVFGAEEYSDDKWEDVQ